MEKEEGNLILDIRESKLRKIIKQCRSPKVHAVNEEQKKDELENFFFDDFCKKKQEISDNEKIIFEKIIKNKNNINYVNKNGDNAINILACRKENENSKKLLDLLLSKNCEPIVNQQGFSFIHLAAYNKNLELIKHIFTQKIDKKSERDLNHLAAIQGNINYFKSNEIITELNELKEKNYKKSIIFTALEYQQVEVAKLLILKCLNEGSVPPEQENLNELHKYVIRGDVNIVNSRIDNDFMLINQKDQNGKTLLETALDYNQKAVAKALIGKICLFDKNYPERKQTFLGNHIKKSTPLHLAAMSGALDVVKYLIENGANKEARDNLGRTPLYVAAEYKQEEIVRYLIEQDCDPQAKNINGQKALYWIVAKCPEFATEVLDKYRILDKYGLNDQYLLKKVEREPIFDREEMTDKGNSAFYNYPYVKSILELIVEQKNYDVASHPVIQELINFKFDQNLWWFWGKFIIDLLFCIVWIVWAVLVPYDQRYLYTFPQDWWRIFLFLLGIIGLITMLTVEIIEGVGEISFKNKIKKIRTKEIIEDKETFLQLNPNLKSFFQEEENLNDNSSSLNDFMHPNIALFFKHYISDLWNILDFVTIIFIFISLITHLADIIDHNDTIARNHIRITSLTILFISLRLSKSLRILWEPLGILILTIYFCIKDILVWIFLFIITWIPFTAAFFILFGNGQKICNKEEECLDEEKTVVGGMENFGKAIFFLYKTTYGLGDIDFEGYNKADSEMADFFFVIYIAFTTLILLNIFIAFLSATFERLHSLSISYFFIERADEILTFEYILSEKKRVNAIYEVPNKLLKRYKPAENNKEGELKILLDPITESVKEISKTLTKSELIDDSCHNNDINELNDLVNKLNELLNNLNSKGNDQINIFYFNSDLGKNSEEKLNITS